jgi:hypothetical protein
VCRLERDRRHGCNSLAGIQLKETGTYQAALFGAQAATVSLGQWAQKSVSLVINGPSVTLVIDKPKDLLRWTFTGVAGQPVRFRLAAAGGCTVGQFDLKIPSGGHVSPFSGDLCFYGTQYIEYVLPETGTYNLYELFPGSVAPAGASVQVLSP